MALHKDFPESPHAILDPAIRWFPADEALRESSSEKLTPPLTPESLRRPHGSIARNPRICEALFLTRYIEKYGTGTLMMIRESLAHALPEPDFAQRGGESTSAVWREWLTDEVLAGFRLNDRQLKAIAYLKANGIIANADYQQLTGVIRKTAVRDLNRLVEKGVVERRGEKRSSHYVLKGRQ